MTKPLSSTDGNKFSEFNPLPELINFIPWELSVISPQMLDSMREIVSRVTKVSIYTNAMAMSILVELAQNGYIEIKEIPLENISGSILIIKRI
jgi:hypothetical protein